MRVVKSGSSHDMFSARAHTQDRGTARRREQDRRGGLRCREYGCCIRGTAESQMTGSRVDGLVDKARRGRKIRTWRSAGPQVNLGSRLAGDREGMGGHSGALWQMGRSCAGGGLLTSFLSALQGTITGQITVGGHQPRT